METSSSDQMNEEVYPPVEAAEPTINEHGMTVLYVGNAPAAEIDDSSFIYEEPVKPSSPPLVAPQKAVRSFVALTPEGTVSSVLRTTGASDVPDGYVEAPEMRPLESLMYAEGEWSVRPNLTEFIAGPVTEIPPLPIATTVEIDDMIHGEIVLSLVTDVEGWSETIDLTDPGSYEIELTPPLPYMPMRKKVTVT
jgi:hypothetical protein